MFLAKREQGKQGWSGVGPKGRCGLWELEKTGQAIGLTALRKEGASVCNPMSVSH